MTAVASSTARGIAPALRQPYLVRFGFAIVWALLLFAGAAEER